MLKQGINIALHLALFVMLTIITQIGGLVYLMALLIVSKKSAKYRLKRWCFFAVLYLVCTMLFVPIIAPLFGREKIKKFDRVAPRTFMTDLLNRNYVHPELNVSLQEIAQGLGNKHPGLKLVYLDANFPFLNKFPLLPHLSHSDGKKIDVSFIYQDKEGKLTNKKPSTSGYGVFESPQPGEYDQIKKCLDKGNWQYDFPRYLTFGTINPDIAFSEKVTKDLILEILKQPSTGKLFIEPHLKSRMNLRHERIRYHGCQAVRHDDHIHFQLK